MTGLLGCSRYYLGVIKAHSVLKISLAHLMRISAPLQGPRVRPDSPSQYQPGRNFWRWAQLPKRGVREALARSGGYLLLPITVQNSAKSSNSLLIPPQKSHTKARAVSNCRGFPGLIRICFTVIIFLIMACYQLHAPFSGSK